MTNDEYEGYDEWTAEQASDAENLGVSSPPDIREAIDAVIKIAPLAHIVAKLLHPANQELAAARSKLETLFREQQEEIEHLKFVINNQNETLVRNSNELSELKSVVQQYAIVNPK